MMLSTRTTASVSHCLDTREFHGYLADLGYRIFTEDALAAASSG
jgi:hypothetical protein